MKVRLSHGAVLTATMLALAAPAIADTVPALMVVFLADPQSGKCMDKPLYYVQDEAGSRTEPVLRYLVGDRVYAADKLTGQRSDRTLSYVRGGKV